LSAANWAEQRGWTRAEKSAVLMVEMRAVEWDASKETRLVASKVGHWAVN